MVGSSTSARQMKPSESRLRMNTCLLSPHLSSMSVHRINLKEALLKEAPKKAPGKPSVTKPSAVKITEPPEPSAETIGTANGLEEVAEALANLAQPPEVAQADLAEPPEVAQKPAFTGAKPPAVPQEPAFPFAGAQPAPFASLAKRKRDVDTKAQQAKATLAQVSSAVAQERATSTHAPLPPTFGTKKPPASAGQSVGKATKKAKTSVASKKKHDTNYDSDEDAQLFGEGKLLLVCVLLRLCCGRSRNRGLLLLLLGCAGGAILIAGRRCNLGGGGGAISAAAVAVQSRRRRWRRCRGHGRRRRHAARGADGRGGRG